jgi:hypothetical protein
MIHRLPEKHASPWSRPKTTVELKKKRGHNFIIASYDYLLSINAGPSGPRAGT